MTISFQSALRINGPSNKRWVKWHMWYRQCFNPPCGSMALRTGYLALRSPTRAKVSIRLADQWPFEPRAPLRIAPGNPFQSALRINGPSNYRTPDGRVVTYKFQSALRINGPSNRRNQGAPCGDAKVSIRLADQWPFERGCQPAPRGARDGFQSALRINGPSNERGDREARGVSTFQSALRINGPSNVMWSPSTPWAGECFNPPCGSMALRTAGATIRRAEG